MAQRRLPNLIAAGADVHVIAIDPRPTVESEPLVTVHRRAYADGDLDGGDALVGGRDVARLTRVGLLGGRRADYEKYGNAADYADLPPYLFLPCYCRGFQ